MRLLAIEGQWSAAQQQYRHLRRDLREQMGVEPVPETEALFAAIRRAASQDEAFPVRREPAGHNLLPSLTVFVGREKELDTLAAVLADPHCRLLTLHGPGGVGKTRLALQVAEEQRGIFREGVFFVPLGAVPTADLLPTAIAEALGFAFFSAEGPAEQLLRWLETRHMLLILDNLEQLLPLQPDDLIPQILQRAPGILILATSRQRLNLREEHLFPVEGLSHPTNSTAEALAGQARVYYADSLMVAREIGDLANQSLVLINLGELALATGQFSESRDYLQQALVVAQKDGDAWAPLVCWINLGEVAVGQYDVLAARQYLAKALPMAQESGEPALLLRALLQIGRLYLLQGQSEQAVTLLGVVIHHEAITMNTARQPGKRCPGPGCLSRLKAGRLREQLHRVNWLASVDRGAADGGGNFNAKEYSPC